MFFRGYIETKGKKPKEGFKNKELKTLDDVKDLDSYAGIIARDAILIDIDDHDQSEILMHIVEDLELNCRVYETTRGKHFFFKNTNSVGKCFTGARLACGLTADIKCGKSNSYSVLKNEGKERKIIFGRYL